MSDSNAASPETPSKPPEEAEASSSETNVPTSPNQVAQTKVDVLLKSAGDAPIMKKKRWAVERSKRISWINEFIKKYVKLDSKESIFLYVNQSFAPALDTEVGSVFDCFNSDGKLVLHYCRSQAWG